jgi:hypothetical protein
MTALVDARGCLTPAGLALVQHATPGTVPAEVAQHLAACARCQGRLLKADLGGPRQAGGHAPIPGLSGPERVARLWRPIVLLVAILALALTALVLLAAFAAD